MATLISVIDAPSQELSVTIDNTRLRLRLNYSYQQDRWVMDVYRETELLLAGRKLLNGFNLVRSFGFGVGAFVVVDERPTKQDPNRINFPQGQVKLYHVPDGEKYAAMAS